MINPDFRPSCTSVEDNASPQKRGIAPPRLSKKPPRVCRPQAANKVQSVFCGGAPQGDFRWACTSQKTLLIPKPVKKLEKLFIAPKVRQVLYEMSQRVFTRCACAQRTGFLIKFFNQESVSDADCGTDTSIAFWRNTVCHHSSVSRYTSSRRAVQPRCANALPKWVSKPRA